MYTVRLESKRNEGLKAHARQMRPYSTVRCSVNLGNMVATFFWERLPTLLAIYSFCGCLAFNCICLYFHLMLKLAVGLLVSVSEFS